MNLPWSEIKDFFYRYTSRKFVSAFLVSYAAYELAGTDGMYTIYEIVAIITPILAFIGVEGWGDAKERSTSSAVESAEEVTFESPAMESNEKTKKGKRT